MRREKIRYKRSKSFLRDFEAIMKIHVPLQLENKMKNLLVQMKLTLALSKWQKNVLKMTTQKSKTTGLHHLQACQRLAARSLPVVVVVIQ